MSRLPLLTVLSVAALGFAGCPTASNLTSARTLDKGALEVTLAPTYLGVVEANPQNAVSGVGIPSAEGQVRYGITDNLELGAKLWMGGFAGHFKVGIIRSESPENGFNLSFDPGLSYSGFGIGGASVSVVYVYLPVLFGFRFNGHELTLGPRVVPLLMGAAAGGSTAGGVTYLGGGSIALSFRLGESFRLTPELSILTSLQEAPTDGFGGFAQFSLGFSFGAN